MNQSAPGGVDPVIITAAVTIVTAAITAIVTIITIKIQHRGKPENALIDQLQDEMGKMRNRMDRFEARDRVYIPHILRLNAHIEAGLGPPAPPIPKVILDYLEPKDGEE
ncbi:hypothetical protein GCM10023081_46620 [Arthrobacter ginkgonis]|uniref:Uncharacterized protein n=1 Tax=Arthrobacter ginkgonis TaxID=1630594 RepID=A0ABP7DJ73_9MICC